MSRKIQTNEKSAISYSQKNMSEYESLRNEIISLQETSRNVWLYMYVIYISLFVFGMEWSYHLFLLEYIILIPFQVIINKYKYSITKVSSYIQAFFEESGEICWEGINTYKEYVAYYTRQEKRIYNRIGKTGSVQLGVLSTVFFLVRLFSSRYCLGRFQLTYVDTILVLGSLVSLFVLMSVNKEYKKDYSNDLLDIMREYKKFREK